jgi:hypothetical protein
MKKEVSYHLVLFCFVVSITTFQSCLKEAEPPSVKTAEVSNIKTQSAVLGGTVVDDGGAAIDLCGVCWGTADNPAIEGNKKYSREGTGDFNCLIFDLIPNTYYHVRAFASNRAGTAYGNEVHFRTKQIVEPKITTTFNFLSVNLTSAEAGGNITSFDETFILERGVCWATTAFPTTNNNKVNCGTGSGVFTCSLTRLQPGTLYNVRAYAVTIMGISYGDEIHFMTLPSPFTVTTSSVSAISKTTAIVSGNLKRTADLEDALILEKGICIGTALSPTIKGYSISVDTIGSNGSFACTLTNLIPGSCYYARAFIIGIESWWFIDSPQGDLLEFIQYGNEVTFTTNP